MRPYVKWSPLTEGWNNEELSELVSEVLTVANEGVVVYERFEL